MRFLLLALLCATPLFAQAGGMLVNTTGEQAKLTASDAANDDAFGSAIAISGDTMVTGSTDASHSGFTSPGAVYVYVRTGNTWTEQQKLMASDPANHALFGDAVAIDGNTIVVGASALNTNTGAAYVFTRTGTNWTQQQKLTASDAAQNDAFGVSVDIDGDTVLVGASGDSHPGGSGSTGANPRQGSAYVFTRTGATWSQQDKLTMADAANFDGFGHSVALDTDTALIGTKFDDHGAIIDAGSAYIFTRNGTAWSERAKLVASNGEDNDHFGSSVSLDGSIAVIGAPDDIHSGAIGAGSAYVFSGSGANWNEVTRLAASLPGWDEHFGTSVSVRGDAICVGTPQRDVYPTTHPGSVFVFINAGGWTQVLELSASDMDDNDLLGASVAMDGQTVVTGANNDTHAGGNFAGGAYAFIPVIGADDQYAVAADASLTVNATQGVLANDRGIGGSAGLTVISSTNSLAGGSVVMNPDGSFTYTPPPGFTGTDSFSYLVSLDGVTIGALPTVWITVNGGSGNGGDGGGSCSSGERRAPLWLATLAVIASALAIRRFTYDAR